MNRLEDDMFFSRNGPFFGDIRLFSEGGITLEKSRKNPHISFPIFHVSGGIKSSTLKQALLVYDYIHLAVNCWFGLVVWISGIPLWKGLLPSGIPWYTISWTNLAGKNKHVSRWFKP